MKSINNKILKTGLVITILGTLLFALTGFTGTEDKKQFGDNVVFYAQHQDDETLWASGAIIEAINEVGSDNVYMVQVSYGTGIKILQQDTFEGMSLEEK